MNRAAVWLAVAVAAAALLGAGLLRFHGGRSLPADPGKPGNLGKDVLAQLRQQSVKEQKQRYQYKVVEGDTQ